MEWVETTGRTVAEALDAALDQLGVDEQDAEVQVLAEPQKGLFGRLRSEARVRARVMPTRPRPKAERRDRRRRGDRDRRGRAGTGTSTVTKPSRDGGAGGGARGKDVVVAKAVEDEIGRNGQDAALDASSGSGKSRRRRRRRGGGGGARPEGTPVTNESTQTEVASESARGLDLDGQREAVDEFLRGLVEALGRPEATVAVRAVDEETLEAEVDGDELGLLVGPKGHTLQAVQELVRSMVQRRFVGQAHARVRVDVGGYRQRRREALERFTHKVADEVISTGRAKALDPMGASDRKVVHDAVNDIDGVRTISEGEEPARRVVIQPA